MTFLLEAQLRNDIELYPRCVRAKNQHRENGDAISSTPRFLAYVNSDYVLPCCWVDGNEHADQIPTLLKEKLKLSNNESIEDIITSDEWVDFFSTLINEPNRAPDVCYRYCGGAPNKDGPNRSFLREKAEIEKALDDVKIEKASLGCAEGKGQFTLRTDHDDVVKTKLRSKNWKRPEDV